MSDVVETRTNDELFGLPVKPGNNNAQAQEQEVKDCTEFLKIEYAKFRQYNIILEGIEDCVEDDSNLDPNLRTKIKNIILGVQVSQTQLGNNSNESNVFGVPFSSTELKYSESTRLHNCLKSKLNEKCAKLSITNHYSPFSFENKESPLELAQEDVKLLDYRDKLVVEQETFINNQRELLELLDKLKTIRLETVPEITKQKHQECNCRTRINYLKSQLAEEKCRMDIFMESSHSLKAYTEVMNDLREQEDKLRLEIQKLRDVKKQYADVACKEYNDILKSYLQYKSSLKKKQLMYELYS